jgi:uncharacterized protein (DUF302 family)
MSFYASRRLDGVAFDAAIDRARSALQAEGFGVLTEIDVAAVMKEKLGETLPPYRILGACNPKLALRVLGAESRIGVMLPCNVVVRQIDDDAVEIVVIDPEKTMGAVGVDNVRDVAAEVSRRLRAVIEAA